jgi:enolase-phosphatase E1
VASFLQSPERPTIFAIYSSGSVLAQKLLFGHSEHGDLLPNIHAHFDTQIGGKLEPSSYTKIAHALNVAPEHVVFISDHPGELLAAHDAGMLPMLVKRPGNHVIDANMQMKLDSAQIKEMSTFKDLSRFM